MRDICLMASHDNFFSTSYSQTSLGDRSSKRWSGKSGQAKKGGRKRKKTDEGIASLQHRHSASCLNQPATSPKVHCTSSNHKPGSSSQQKPGTPSHHKPGSASHQKPGTSSHHKPGSSSHQKPGTPSYHKPGSSSHQKPGTPSHHKPGSSSHLKPGTPSHHKPGSSSHHKPGTPSHHKPGTPSHHKLGSLPHTKPDTSSHTMQDTSSQFKHGTSSQTKPGTSSYCQPNSSSHHQSHGSSQRMSGTSSHHKPDTSFHNKKSGRGLPNTSPNQCSEQSESHRHKSKHRCRSKGDKSWNNRNRKTRQNQRQQSLKADEDESSSADSDVLEIPGFYFDKLQNRYFRILPGQNNVNAGVVTKTTVLHAQAETKRQKDLKGPDSSKKVTDKRKRQVPWRISTSRNVCKLISNFETGHLKHAFQSERSLALTAWCNLQHRGSVKVFPSPSNPYEKLEHMNKMLLSRDKRKLLCLWSVAGLVTQRIQMLNLEGLDCTDDDRSLGIKLQPAGTAILQSLSKITNMCWAPISSPDTNLHDNSILYTTTCFLGNSPSLAMLRNLDSTTVEGFRHTEFSLGRKATWTCAWNQHLKRFSVGSEKCGLLLDVETRKLWELHSASSDVLAQAFSPQISYVCDSLLWQDSMLYSGTRRGDVLGHDLRSNSTRPTCSLPHNSGVCHIHIPHDSNFMTTAHFNGKLQRWDMRMEKVILSYHGNVNEYSRLPFHVDDEEEILYTVGADSYTRMWDYNTGHLLRSLPPPHPAARETIPCVAYTDYLITHLPTLMMGTLNKLHVFSL